MCSPANRLAARGFVGHRKDRVGQPAFEFRIVAELFVELGIILEHRGHDAFQRLIMLDLRILLMTVKSVVMRTGISHRGEATMPFFQGASDSTEIGSPESALAKPLTQLQEVTGIRVRPEDSGMEGSA